MPIRFDYSVVENTIIKKYSNNRERHTTVFLSDEGEPTAIHCMYCKKTLFECQHSLALIAPGTPPVELKSLKLKCPNPGCNTFYHFVSAV